MECIGNEVYVLACIGSRYPRQLQAIDPYFSEFAEQQGSTDVSGVPKNPANKLAFNPLNGR